MERIPGNMFTQAANCFYTRPPASFEAVASPGQVHIMTNISDMVGLLVPFSANQHLGPFDFKTYLQGHLKVSDFSIFNLSTGFDHFKPFQVFLLIGRIKTVFKYRQH